MATTLAGLPFNQIADQLWRFGRRLLSDKLITQCEWLQASFVTRGQPSGDTYRVIMHRNIAKQLESMPFYASRRASRIDGRQAKCKCTFID